MQAFTMKNDDDEIIDFLLLEEDQNEDEEDNESDNETENDVDNDSAGREGNMHRRLVWGIGILIVFILTWLFFR